MHLFSNFHNSNKIRVIAFISHNKKNIFTWYSPYIYSKGFWIFYGDKFSYAIVKYFPVRLFPWFYLCIMHWDHGLLLLFHRFKKLNKIKNEPVPLTRVILMISLGWTFVIDIISVLWLNLLYLNSSIIRLIC